MGAGASSLSGTLNRADLLKATQSPRFLMDKILEYMLTQINEKDVFKMSDSSSCQKFLILSAGALEKMFYELDVQPSTDKSGKLYFRKVAELTAPPKDSVEAQQLRTNCQAIAYFFIRILQIYIALAYTILDDPRIMPQSGMRYTAGPVQQLARPQTPGRRLVYLGGALTEIEGPLTNKIIVGGDYRWDIQTLISKFFTSGGLASEIRLRNNNEIILKKLGTYTAKIVTTVRSNDYEQRGYWGGPPPSNREISFTITLEKSKTNQTPRIVINSIMPKNKREPIRLDTTKGGYWISVNPELTEGRGKGGASSEPLDTIFVKIIESLKTTDYETVVEAYRHSKGAEERAEAAAATGYNYGRYGAKGVAGLQAPSGPSALKFDDTLGPLRPSDVRPLAHCIARSFQLLNIDALAGAPARSSICTTQFATKSMQLPGADGQITKIPGLKAFELLYFVLGKSVGLSSQTKEGYNVALKYLFEKFQGKGSAPVATKDEQYLFGSIKSGQVGRCSSSTGEIKLDKAQTAIAKQGVAALWGYQRAHAAKVEKLFMQLFDIGRQRDGSLAIKISENLFKGGIPAVERVANEARILLGEYYGKCEEIYRGAASKL
jgi:hypothetical protein